jgi:hypothetical protein
MTASLDTYPSNLKRALGAFLACGLLATASPLVTDAAAAPKSKSTTTATTTSTDTSTDASTDTFSGTGRKN